MKFIPLILPVFMMTACSPTSGAPDLEPAILKISADAQAAMDEINTAILAPAASGALQTAETVTPAESPMSPAADPTVNTGAASTESTTTPSAEQSGAAVSPIVNPVKYDAALVRVEVLLDRAHFSPGVIDGYNGENVRKAVSAYQAAHGMPVNGQANDVLLKKLTAADTAPALVAYTLTKADVTGPFALTPKGLEAMSKVKHLGFQRPSEAIAEKFHMDEDLLRTLNPGADFSKAGAEIVVANRGGGLDGKVASIVIDKRELSLRAFDSSGKLLAYYPASIGSGDAPAPSGDYAVRAVAFDPTYHYDPKRLPTFGDTGHGALTIPAGPNNPVGDTWIALTLDTYGIHGSPEGQQVSKTQSHGCVRLTNWDATELGKAVSAGIPVSFRDAGLQAQKAAPRG